jgi:hypothetical protein
MSAAASSELHADIKNIAIGSRYAGELAKALVDKPPFSIILGGAGLSVFGPLSIMTAAVVNTVAKNGATAPNMHELIVEESRRLVRQFVDNNAPLLSDKAIRQRAIEIRAEIERLTASYRYLTSEVSPKEPPKALEDRSESVTANNNNNNNSNSNNSNRDPVPIVRRVKSKKFVGAMRDNDGKVKDHYLRSEQSFITIEEALQAIPEENRGLAQVTVCNRKNCGRKGLLCVKFLTAAVEDGTQAKRFYIGVDHPVDKGPALFHAIEGPIPTQMAVERAKRYNQTRIPSTASSALRTLGVVHKVDPEMGAFTDFYEFRKQHPAGLGRKRHGDKLTELPQQS